MPAAKNNKFSERKLGEEVIRKYMQKRDIPDWFRGISNFQSSAAETLFEALLYDLEQHSTHRVRDCLTSLGLKPMVPTGQLKKLMLLSRGSDLAFLWFLLETNYKSKGPGYSTNEQILYSSIAHLDMVTTLRELDRLLPKQAPKKAAPPKDNKIEIIVRPEQFKQFKLPKRRASPYLQPVTKTVDMHRPITLERPNPKLNLADYQIHKDPKYMVRNESNRWFANYVTRTSRRIVCRLLREEIDKLLNNIDKVDDKPPLCQYHKRLIEGEIKRKQDLKRKACERMQQHFDVDGVRKACTRKRILDEIERNVKMLMQKSRYDEEKRHLHHGNGKQNVEILEGEGSIRYCDPNKEDKEYELKRIRGMESMLNEWEKDENNDTLNDPCERVSMTSFCGLLERKSHCNWFTQKLCCKSKTTIPSTDPDDDAVGSNSFFKASEKHKPWQFDYQKIFNVDHAKPTEEQRLKQILAKALNSQYSPDIHGHVNIEKEFEAGFKRQWAESVEAYNRRMEEEAKHRLNEDEIYPMRFDRDHFDPEDTKYMLHMLKRCFDRMKKNPKFVLASLPDAHKLPTFLYFVQDRYGKRYTLEERQTLFAESMKILRALQKLTAVTPMPNISGFSKSPHVSYACRNYLLAKSEKTRQTYYDELNTIIMHQARIFWFALRPYLCSSGPPRHMYFAYMPSTPVDNNVFRQWKNDEYMDVHSAWVRRQKKDKRF